MAPPRPAPAGPGPGPVRRLPRDSCWHLLAATPVGRVAYVESGGPVVLPVSHVVRDGAIWWRTATWTGLAVHLHGWRVAFEADELDAPTRSGWSVLARGGLEHVRTGAEPEPAGGWPTPVPWPDDRRRMLFRLVPDELTGRAFGSWAGSPTA